MEFIRWNFGRPRGGWPNKPHFAGVYIGMTHFKGVTKEQAIEVYRERFNADPAGNIFLTNEDGEIIPESENTNILTKP